MKALLALAAILLSMAGCTERVPLENPALPRPESRQILRFVASPQIVQRGEMVMLHWDARNVPEVVLEQALDPKADIRADFQSLGTFPTSGTLAVYPQENTTYVLTCGNELIGCSSAAIRIIVK
jgi:hypothetical protein